MGMIAPLISILMSDARKTGKLAMLSGIAGLLKRGSSLTCAEGDRFYGRDHVHIHFFRHRFPDIRYDAYRNAFSFMSECAVWVRGRTDLQDK
jgi:hypothetical protein